MPDDELEIDARLVIRMSEIVYTTSRSGGPGGQHVNKSDTKVTLRFDLRGSPSLSDSQRARLEEQLAARLTNDGELVMSAASERSQSRNREAVTARFVALLRGALKRRAHRVPTKPTKGSQRRRMDEKKRRGDVKRDRGKDWRGGD